MVRSRPPVGRRLWRRRRRRADDATAPASSVAGRDEGDDGDDGEEGDGHDARTGVVDEPAPSTASAVDRPGFFARLFGRKTATVDAAPTVVDPTREILALPRGVARLDAFERRLGALVAGDAAHRRVALAFQTELQSLADDAGVDLQLFETRVTACANALIAAGEDEKAGALFARLGRRHQAAELFVRAGAIDALEEQHAARSFDEGGTRLDARLSFERFEALFLVGLRDDALAALERACALWDNPVYAEVLAGFRARIPDGGVLHLTSGDDVVGVVARFPIVIGRGEECAVRLDSPLVSRAHVELADADGAVVARALATGGSPTMLDEKPLSSTTTTSLLPRGAFQLAGVALDYEQDPQRLLLRPRLRPRHVTLVVRGDAVDDAVVGACLVVRDGRFRARVDARTRINGEPLRRDTLLLVGDRLTVGARTWTVARR